MTDDGADDSARVSAELACYACGRRYPADGPARCDCGEPTWYDVDASAFDWLAGDGPAAADRSLWRYRDLLPLATAPDGLAGAVGGTPLVRATRLDDDVGASVHVKVEGGHPTGSFKDRGSAVGVAGARALGYDAVGTVSHGNMARSMAAHAASAGLDCTVLVPADIPDERLALVARHAPAIRRVEGDYDRLYERSLAVGDRAGVRFVNSDSPLRVAGQKSTALEVAEAFAPETPDAMVLPASSGGHASATWKAFCDLQAAGVVDDPPRLYFVQTAACAPIAEAFERGAESVEGVDPGETVAYSIANANPPSGARTLAAARATDGAVLAVDDDAILDARRTLAERGGLFVETACATALAAARDLADRGTLEADDDVVLVATGTGFTEREVDPPTVDADAIALDELERVLS